MFLDNSKVHHIDASKRIKDKKAIRNIKIRDNKCFMWTIF